MTNLVVGMDEVGRGCWAGPLVVGAVVLRKPIAGLRDSKLLSPGRRSELDAVIRGHALAVSLGWVEAGDIDELGLTRSLVLAYERALANLRIDQTKVRRIIIDGNRNYLPHLPHVQALIDADATEPAVSAASIIAKVARDKHMIQMSVRHPGYGFENHVGYGTPEHQAALALLGVCELHRISYRPVHDKLMGTS